jgi:hypothetical protein
VSDAFGSALWALDFFFDNAENGSRGINFHGGGIGMDGTRPFRYSPIDEANGAVTGAAPVFYGMLFMTLAGTGNTVATTVSAGALNFSAHTLVQSAQSGGATQVFLVNKDATSTVKASLDVGVPAASSSAYYLQAPMLGAMSGITVAGAPISPAGAWAPLPPYAVSASGHVLTVIVPPASAALVHVP